LKPSVIIIASVLVIGSALVFYWQLEEKAPTKSTDSTKKAERVQSRSKKSGQQSTMESPVRRNLKLDEKKNLLAEQSPSIWQFKVEDQKISRAFGGKIKMESEGENQIVETAKKFAESFDLAPNELADQALPVGGRRLPGVQVYSIGQVYEGYPVYQARLRVSVNNETNEIVGFNSSELKELHSELPTQLTPKNKMFKDLNKRFGGFSFSEMAGPYVFPDKDGRARLVYEGKTGEAENYNPQTRRILVDAETGEIFDRGPIAVSDDFHDHGEQ